MVGGLDHAVVVKAYINRLAFPLSCSLSEPAAKRLKVTRAADRYLPLDGAAKRRLSLACTSAHVRLHCSREISSCHSWLAETGCTALDLRATKVSSLAIVFHVEFEELVFHSVSWWTCVSGCRLGYCYGLSQVQVCVVASCLVLRCT